MSDFSKEIQAQLQSIDNAAKQQSQLQSHVALQGLRPPVSKTNTGDVAVPTYDDKVLAVNDIYDIQEKCNLPFIILGDLARMIRDKTQLGSQPHYDGDKIEFGFNASNLVPEIKSLFRTWNFEETTFNGSLGYKYFFSPPTKWDVKIPVEIHCFTRKYPFFDNPDVGFFGVDEYRIPNPFEKYWAVRGLIK